MCFLFRFDNSGVQRQHGQSRPKRQDSYLQAISSVEVNTHYQQQNQQHQSVQQTHYQADRRSQRSKFLIQGFSMDYPQKEIIRLENLKKINPNKEKSKLVAGEGWGNRQNSYQQAVGNLSPEREQRGKEIASMISKTISSQLVKIRRF